MPVPEPGRDPSPSRTKFVLRRRSERPAAGGHITIRGPRRHGSSSRRHPPDDASSQALPGHRPSEGGGGSDPPGGSDSPGGPVKPGKPVGPEKPGGPGKPGGKPGGPGKALGHLANPVVPTLLEILIPTLHPALRTQTPNPTSST